MNLTRRNALKLLGAASLTGSAWARAGHRSISLGAQTNAWPIDAKQIDSFFDVLAQIKRTGYNGFETGYFNLEQHLEDIPSLHARIEATGLTFFGLHIAVGATKCDPETLLPLSSLYEPLVGAAKQLGAQNWIVSSIAAKHPDQIPGKVAGLRKAAEVAAKTGLPLLYHNHWWEFANGGTEIEALFDGTKNSPVRFLLDAGHAFKAGADVPAFLQAHLPRIAGLHLRDYRDGKQVPLGQGTFPLAAVADVLKKHRWTGWVINEEDSDGKQKLGLNVIEPAYKALHGAFPS